MEFRRHKKFGLLFGLYVKPMPMYSETDFKLILPNENVPKDRFHPKYGIIKLGDKMSVLKLQKPQEFP